MEDWWRFPSRAATLSPAPAPMPTLAQTLGTTAPVLPLLRKARRFGLRGVQDMIALAASRGCHHYRPEGAPPPDLPSGNIADEELVVLLTLGENACEPMAVRCAAQLALASGIDPKHLARLSAQHKTERVLADIARAGGAHDAEGNAFWTQVLKHLPACHPREESNLPRLPTRPPGSHPLAGAGTKTMNN